jgi:hypothetical protein
MGARSLKVLVEISPCSGDKRAGSIRKDEDQIQIAFSVRATEKLQGLPLQRVVITQDGNFGREVLDVGSMS